MIQLAGLGAVLLCLDWRLGLVMTLPVPFLCFWVYLHGERMNRLFLRAWRKWSRVTDVVADTIPGMRVVKAFHQEEREKGRFGERNYAATEEFNRIHDIWTSFWPALMLAVRVMIVAVWALAVPRLLGDGAAAATLSSGTFVAFLLYLTMFIAADRDHRADRAHHESRHQLGAPHLRGARHRAAGGGPHGGRAPRAGAGRGALRERELRLRRRAPGDPRRELRGASRRGDRPGRALGRREDHRHQPDRALLRPDRRAASGSTAWTSATLDQGHYRRQIGMVLQEPYLFHGTVLENIRYGKHDATLDEVVVAARAANAHDFVCQLPHGYETMVGERGHTLSGGERQRVSIARAILHDPRILILDEATSRVDTETECKIQEALDRLVAGRTVFAIAHRLSTLRRASRLFVIEDGKLTEQGTHAELLALAGGTYRRLYGMQRQLTAESGSLDESALDQEVA